jgi:hypothetical protein
MLSTQPSRTRRFPEQYAEVTILLERDADGTAQDKDGRTPFDMASDRGVAEVAYVLSLYRAHLIPTRT